MVKRINNNKNPLVDFMLSNRDYVLDVIMSTGDEINIYPDMIVNDLSEEYINIINPRNDVQLVINVNSIISVRRWKN